MLAEPRDVRRDTARLASFLQECLTLGNLRGFKYFETFLRGREELVLCTRGKRRLEPWTLMPPAVLARTHSRHIHHPQLTSETIPLSPSDENLLKHHEPIIFLFTGYSRYKCPYIYLRSQHEHLVLQEEEESQQPRGSTSSSFFDQPLTLKTDTAWRRHENVGLWQMVCEVLTIVLDPKPVNPLEIDFQYLDSLPLEEAVFLTGGLIHFLQEIWLQAEPSTPLAAAGKSTELEGFSFDSHILFVVYEDIKSMQNRHLANMYEYTARKDEP
ncbi:hypothetical protein BCR43DRAFT_519744 [Syncephalastrum racemosum]|uniref:DUF7886 domain-containing protein n=1 Tax=Syncephalastrum racemosum TaxID=13706 RepID=A0A1X2HTI6_SYNRA|nr:hypothetical protein BCR43DRAFT_519744 [Syncephalastrum racemosum]